MKEKNRKDIWKKRWRDIVIMAVCVAAVVVTAVLYSEFASRHIFRESADHLQGIYEQLNARIHKQIEDERSLLKSWQKYIADSMRDINNESLSAEDRLHKEKEFTEFMQQQQREWKFTDFYFIAPTTLQQEEENAKKPERYKYEYECKSPLRELSADGGYAEPKEYAITLRRSLRLLLDEDSGGVVGICKQKDNPADEGKLVMLFAVRAAESGIAGGANLPEFTYEGFSFTSIAVCFDTDQMLEMLNVEVFGDDSEFYITLEDGTVLLQEGGAPKENYLTYLDSRDCKVNNRSYSAIVADFTPVEKDNIEQSVNTVLITDRSTGVDRYVTYMPVGFGAWMMVGVANTDAVNSSMNWFRTVTVIVMAVIFVMAFAAVAWVLILRNRRRAQEQQVALKSREDLFDLLTFNTNDLFVLFSPDDFTGEYVSSNIGQVLGIDVGAVKADIRTLLLAADGKHGTFTADGLAKLPVGQTWETDLQLHHMTENKTYWFHLTMYHSLYNGHDSYIMMFSDRTKERSLNASLEDALQIAKSANEAKSNFLSNMSHDIRTPMNAILGFATLLAKDADNPEKVREYIRKISFSGQHLLSLINDILDMSKIESGKTTLHVEEFAFPEFMEELYAIMAPQANAKKQSFEMYTKGRLPERVVGDRLRLNQVILNLLSNAVKYTPDGGHIDLTVEALDKRAHNHTHLRISVKDDGIGMSEEFVKTVFDPFAREITSQTKGIQGTGLGMAIAKNIVNLMGGSLTVTSKLGEGSTFVVEIELAVGGQHEDDKEFWKRNNVTRVLVVDDEEDICVGVRELMEGTGVDVHYALNGFQAVEMVSEAFDGDKAYHIVLLDWKMPEMDGIETAKRIRKKVGPNVPIMVLTSYNFDEIEEQAKEAGINMFLAKPFFVSNFRNAIEKLRDGDTKELTGIPSEVNLSGMHVLAAEDNEINAEILIELLQMEGVTCEIAVNGQEAVEKFTQAKPGSYDLIFMDVQMPILNGYDATRAIRASRHPEAKTIPIIAMTANAFDDDVRKALESGMTAHLSKPIDMQKLKAAVAGFREGKK